ncbi:hypothetical protein P8891_06425 [Bacillus atrophaeus]|uniref:hypothetical protein n=1 Tax=Bacillus atrophaeus TaxID=1452 RepID=UPI00227EFBB3|nr:hypothetical protein [Bacillus atrophaeus]MCY7947984.1 hypothetical protein [Bacillus atrophaeus]MCY8098070.1 hypothetical protein [Bacillus atrophaeus]MCY9169994.1 hypothetical protein [Bacillus atrophaeus]MEC0740720.1 hypothetical protein [Bacillus atrophaeus]MEC0747017.1 hypothetical protein [Bacillus atrophaeus]
MLLFEAELKKLTLDSLYQMESDIKKRIDDGMTSNHKAYVNDQTKKLEVVSNEIKKRNQTNMVWSK